MVKSFHISTNECFYFPFKSTPKEIENSDYQQLFTKLEVIVHDLFDDRSQIWQCIT